MLAVYYDNGQTGEMYHSLELLLVLTTNKKGYDKAENMISYFFSCKIEF